MPRSLITVTERQSSGELCPKLAIITHDHGRLIKVAYSTGLTFVHANRILSAALAICKQLSR